MYICVRIYYYEKHNFYFFTQNFYTFNFFLCILQIPRMDPCEMCVCVDSEMYCFWKLCTFFKTAVTTPLATSSSDSLNNRNTATTQSINDNKIILDNFNEEAEKFKDNDVTNEKYSKLLTDQRKYNVLKKLEATSPEQVTTTEQPSTSKFTSSTAEPTVCYVMGKYQ